MRDRMKEKNEKEKCPVLIRAVKKPIPSCSEMLTIINYHLVKLAPLLLSFELGIVSWTASQTRFI